ncbi:MAG: Sec-independent protein translocase protein TatB [Pseudodonghicola sp.]
MFDMGWSELLVIGVVALIVVGPKDLPVLFRNVGRFVGKARGMAREFSRAMNEAADESGVRDVAKTFKTATNPLGSAMDGVKDAARGLTEGLGKDKFDPESETCKLAAQRAEDTKRIQAATARAAAERKAREAEEALKKAEEAEADLQAMTATASAPAAPEEPESKI